MRAVKGVDTTPELVVRRLAYGMGYRFRLHRKDLPGKPDLVFAGRRSVIFVHGCFWHGHKCARGDRLPKANAEYWNKKITRNAARDKLHVAALRKEGWRVGVIWECQLKDPGYARRFLSKFLG
jgi:DNA mismatch endonuclease (patch repair protein)